MNTLISILVLGFVTGLTSITAQASHYFEPSYDWVEHRLDQKKSFTEKVSCYANLRGQGALNLRVFVYHYHHKIEATADDILFAIATHMKLEETPETDYEVVDQVYAIHYPNEQAFVNFGEEEYWERERKQHGYYSFSLYTSNGLRSDLTKAWDEIIKLSSLPAPKGLEALLSEQVNTVKLTKLPVGHAWSEDYPRYESMITVFSEDSGARVETDLYRRAQVIKDKKLKPVYQIVYNERKPSESKLLILNKSGKKATGTLSLSCESVSRTAIYW